MGHNQEKEAFFHDMVLALQNHEDQDILLKKLQDLLIADTVDGKLYKYRFFDSKGNSLQILRDGTLFCSKASAFNDPFDCRVGIDYQSMTSDLCEVELSGIEGLLEKYMQIIRNEANLEDFSREDQIILSKWMESEVFSEIVSFAQVHTDMTEGEKRLYLTSHLSEIIDVLVPAIHSEKYRDHLKITRPALLELGKKLSSNGTVETILGTHSITEFAQAKGIRDDRDEIGLMNLLCKQLDPSAAESVRRTEQFIDTMTHNLSERLDRLFYVGSLCTSNKNRLMWSHYADSHRGFCIEYDYSDETALLPLPVIYSRRRPKLSWKAAFDNTPGNQKAASIPFLEAILTKDDAWEYENEWRLIISAEMDQKVEMPPITCIYLGVNCSDENRSRILEIANEKSIPVKQMEIDRGEFTLHVADQS